MAPSSVAKLQSGNIQRAAATISIIIYIKHYERAKNGQAAECEVEFFGLRNNFFCDMFSALYELKQEV